MARRTTRENQTGRNLIILAALILLLLLLAALAFLYLSRRNQPTTGAGDSESAASRTTPAAGTSGSPIANIGSGGSLNGGWFQLYFTAPKYPDNPADHKGGLDEKLVALMDTAKRSLDVADYDFDLANVADAMVRAKSRGVVVRMVTDTDTLTNTKNKEVQNAFAKLKGANIPIVDDQRPAIMHNKFTVVDQEWVETGSWNYTDGDTYHLNNHMIILQSKELATNYTTEFSKMFDKRQFGATKDKAIPNPVVTVNGTKIQNCFAAEGKCEDQIVNTIKGSQKSIYFLAFSFTADKIGQAMVERHKAGVALGGVFETTGSNTPFSEYTKMKKEGVEVYTDGNPWVMHHKVIIIDERIVVFGSFNFSDNADTQNDENLLIVDNPDIARAFKAEYDRVLALAQNPPVKKK
jgi:phosphatidylserine/phosphatidylglycerophosphate/cardiolipin synthase-like enzyme